MLVDKEPVVGDTVMWTNIDSPYSRWFYSQVGIVESINNGYCRVRWCFPVEYCGLQPRLSDFSLKNFSTYEQGNEQSKGS
jgi:hypothetical protein